MYTYYLGLDGGGTETTVLVTDGEKDLYRIRTGGLNYNSFSKEQIKETLTGVSVTLKKQGFGADECLAVGIGAAGVSNPAAKRFLEESFSQLGFQCPVKIFGDDETALAGAFGEEDGIILISGTGAVCLGQTDHGRERYRAGGFGHLIDDEGSAYAIGRDLLSAIVRAEDGRIPATTWKSTVFAYLKISSIPELIAWVYDPSHTKREIADLARLLSLAETKDDPVTGQIIDHAARGLYEMLKAVCGKMQANCPKQEIPLVLWGGVLCGNEKIVAVLNQRIQENHLPVIIESPKADAAMGAAWLAGAREAASDGKVC